MNRQTKLTRYCRVMLLAAIATGVFIRVWHFDRIAIDHFDEGVYSGSLWFAGTDEGQYPSLHLYAPPLLPTAIDWCQFLFGPTTLASLLPSLLGGCLTILLVWKALIRWYGPDAAIAGVWLAALSDVHQVYSRMALTDVLLSFFVLLAVMLGIDAIIKGGLRRILTAGFATAFAWWTKYNGWLPLAILSSGTIAWMVVHRPWKVAGSADSSVGKTTSVEVSAFRIVGRLILIIVVAVVAWLPVLHGLEDVGGYASVAANHRQYLLPISEWKTTLQRQIDNHRVLEQVPSWMSVCAVFVLAGLLLAVFDRRFTWNQSEGSTRSIAIRWMAGLLCLAVGVLYSGVFSVLLVGGLIGLLGSLKWPVELILDKKEPTSTTNGEPDSEVAHSMYRTLSTWNILAWIIGLLVATPFYRPYPRLTLPWLVGLWLAGSIAFAWWMRATMNVVRSREESRQNGSQFARKPVIVSVVAVVALVIGRSSGQAFPTRISCWENRTDIKSVASRIAKQAGGKERLFFVFSEPSLLHHLNSLGQAAVPTATLTPVAPTGYEAMLVMGNEARRSPDYQARWDEMAERWTPVFAESYEMSTVVDLNEPVRPQLLRAPQEPGHRPSSRIEVFRIHR